MDSLNHCQKIGLEAGGLEVAKIFLATNAAAEGDRR